MVKISHFKIAMGFFGKIWENISISLPRTIPALGTQLWPAHVQRIWCLERGCHSIQLTLLINGHFKMARVQLSQAPLCSTLCIEMNLWVPCWFPRVTDWPVCLWLTPVWQDPRLVQVSHCLLLDYHPQVGRTKWNWQKFHFVFIPIVTKSS